MAGSGVGFFCASFPVMGVNGQGKFSECQEGLGLVVVDHIVLDTLLSLLVA